MHGESHVLVTGLIIVAFPLPALASQFKIDAALFHNQERRTYIFHGETFSTYDYRHGLHILSGTDLSMKDRFPGIPSNVDAAFFNKVKQIFFFKDGNAWEFSDQSAKTTASNLFPSGNWSSIYPSRPDAVAIRPGKRAKSFFKGDQCWTSKDNRREVKPGFPKLLQHIHKDAPSNIDAAVGISDALYLFKYPFLWKFRYGGSNDLLQGFPMPFYEGLTGKEISTVQTLKPQLVFFSNINLSGKRLVGFTSKTVNVASLQACFEECSKMKPLHCKSLNYKTVNNGHASTHSCELNTKKKEHDVSNNFNFDREYIYYEVLA